MSLVFFFKQKTAYEMRISDWSSAVCSSDLCPNCGTGRLALRGGRFGPFIACSNYPECKYTRKFAQPGGTENGGDNGPETLGTDPDSEIGRASCRDRVCQYVYISVVTGAYKKKK